MKDDAEHITPEDELKAENELIKLKLELEHGMKQSDTSSLSPEVQNQWLTNIYNFEQQYKDAKRVKVYDVIGRPYFKKCDELLSEEVPGALEQILSLMSNKGIVLDCLCTYEDAIIYRFITEELFEHETDDILIEGMVQHFIYEEFHPNHDYDLRRFAKDFTENLLKRKWHPGFDTCSLASVVSYKERDYNNEELSAIILAFQCDRTFHVEKFEIDNVSFDIEKGEAAVRAHLAYYAIDTQGNHFQQGNVELDFSYQYGYWYLKGFLLPGFGA